MPYQTSSLVNCGLSKGTVTFYYLVFIVTFFWQGREERYDVMLSLSHDLPRAHQD